MAAFTPHVAYALLPGKMRRATVLVVERLSADTVRVYGPDGHLHALPKTAVGRLRRSPHAQVQMARLGAEYARIQALVGDLRPHSRGRRPRHTAR
jgi:hypothetical protein